MLIRNDNWRRIDIKQWDDWLGFEPRNMQFPCEINDFASTWKRRLDKLKDFHYFGDLEI